MLLGTATTQPISAARSKAVEARDAQGATDTTQASEKSHEEDLAEVLDELAEVGALDPDAKRLLMADLEEAKPENWPLIVRQFRSALAFRQQLAERELEVNGDELLPLFTEQPAVVKTQTAKRTDRHDVEPPQAEAVIADSEEIESAEQPSNIVQAERSYLVEANSVTANSVTTKLPEPLAANRPSVQQFAQPVSYVAGLEAPRDWHGHLQSAIEDLQLSVQPSPGSSEEVNQHMRLRLMQLLAGDKEASLQPIPGATAPQQDYWNQQLFAVSTYLDSESQPDNKRRAASSLMHLDQARTKLAELATLQVRRLSFVDSVEGYGAYEPREESKFRPGDQVVLYAEIENFSSESTKDGYRTRLGTSYEVVDKSGKRVDSAQFPEVEDLCRTARRDFHMQYTVTLPMRIYPEQYEIRLIITDQQSHKIGQASVPFEILD